MKKLITNYTFNKTAGTITFTDYVSLGLSQLLLITNVTIGQIIYNFADPSLGGTIVGNILTLECVTSGMNNSDNLQIFLDDLSSPSSEATLSGILAMMPTAPALRLSRRSAYDSVNSYQYIGTAAYGTAESDSGWTVVRLTLAADGSVSANVSATGSWTGRAGLTYS